MNINIGIGTGDGAAKIVNLSRCDIETENHVHDMVIKGISFSESGEHLATGTPEFDIDFLKNKR